MKDRETELLRHLIDSLLEIARSDRSERARNEHLIPASFRILHNDEQSFGA